VASEIAERRKLYAFEFRMCVANNIKRYYSIHKKNFLSWRDDDLSSFEATKLDATHRSSKNSYEALKQSRDNERKKNVEKSFYFTTTIHRAFNVFCALNERASFM
jgi:hypothetical protein